MKKTCTNKAKAHAGKEPGERWRAGKTPGKKARAGIRLLALALAALLPIAAIAACGGGAGAPAGTGGAAGAASTTSEAATPSVSADGSGAAESSGDGAGDAADSGSPADAARAAGEETVLNLSIATEPTSFDPNAGIGDTLMFTNGHLYEAVTRLDANDNPVPGMALDWTVSEDGLTYEFTIRDDNGWSNGAKATAADFEYGVKRILSHEIGENWSFLVFDIKNAAAAFAGEVPLDEVGIKADGNKLTITLDHPEAYFPRLLTFAPYFGVNREFVEGAGGKYGTEAELTLSSGPYYVESWAHDDMIVLRKNPYYWNRDNVKIDKINIYIIGDENTTINMFQTGELDIIDFSGAKRNIVESNGGDVQTYHNGRSVYLQANLRSGAASNKKIRQALSSAIDRELFVTGVLKDASSPAEGLTATGIASGVPGTTFRDLAGATLAYGYDPGRAQELFAEGLAELGLSAADVSLRLISRNTEPYLAAAAALQEIFQNEFGITVSAEPLESTSYSAARTDMNYDLCLVSWGADWDDATTFLYDGVLGDYLDPQYADSSAFADLRKKAEAEREPQARAEYLAGAERAMLEDSPLIPIWTEAKLYAVADRLKGVHRRAIVPYLDILGAEIAG
ncbi:MAG: peptide ABC transporter substrate-binding protein [Clostridiales bacterium]|nr:peptide ABC transporter substrate-binding protein [Clostridiales bacterium]